MMITKELAFVYIVNGKKFLKKEDAVNYMNKVKEKKIVKTKGRDFVIANIQAPSGLKSSENEGTDNDDPTTESGEEEKEEATSE